MFNNIKSLKPSMVILLSILLLACTALAITRLSILIQILQSPLVYRKDILQEYLVVKAVSAGIDPYLPLPDLAQKFIGELPVIILPNPTPHPPPVAVFFYPLSIFDFPFVATIWFTIEISCLIWIGYRISKWAGVTKALPFSLFLAFISISWTPIYDDLVYGQLTIVILGLLVETWLAVNNDRPILAGIFLGVAISLKLFVWPVLLYYIIKRYDKLILATVITFITANLVAGVVMGFRSVVTYYLQASDQIYSLFKSDIFNFSAWSIGWRVFEGTYSPVHIYAEAKPLIDAPFLAPYISTIIPLSLLAYGLWLAIKSENQHISFGILIIVCIMISPITWSHYLSLVIIPSGIAFRTLYTDQTDRKYLSILIILLFIFFIPNSFTERILASFALSPLVNGQDYFIPPHIALITLLPLVALFLFIHVLYIIDRSKHNHYLEVRAN